MPVLTSTYQAPAWLPGGDAQTVYPARFIRCPEVPYRRQAVDMPDGDFMLFDWAGPEPEDPAAPVVVLLHGLEGDSSSHYALDLMHAVAARGWRGVVAHFRGCGGCINRLWRAYNAGDVEDCHWVMRTAASMWPRAPLFAVGVSLGGNQLAKYLGDYGGWAWPLKGAASIGAPMDLAAGFANLERGFGRLYDRMFMQTLREKLLIKSRMFPGRLEREAILACKTLKAFDDLYTAPAHGYASAEAYWREASCKPSLPGVRRPLLMLNARNDPFLPPDRLASPDEVSADVWLEYSDEGGHIGFARDPFPGRLGYLPERVLAFFDAL
ncbi:MAG: alpha/beta fold hydrolase [Duodenibacillus sp.]|nr:alpha/beta fold hydrolase [Duodenibacillus sp.]